MREDSRNYVEILYLNRKNEGRGHYLIVESCGDRPQELVNLKRGNEEFTIAITDLEQALLNVKRAAGLILLALSFVTAAACGPQARDLDGDVDFDGDFDCDITDGGDSDIADGDADTDGDAAGVDNGFEIDANGLEIVPRDAPYYLSGWSGFDLEETARWWNPQVNLELVEVGEPADFIFTRGLEFEVDLYSLPADGTITGCQVRIPPDVADDPELAAIYLRHAVGRCLGLALDTLPESVMFFPPPADAVLTDGDFERLREVVAAD